MLSYLIILMKTPFIFYILEKQSMFTISLVFQNLLLMARNKEVNKYKAEKKIFNAVDGKFLSREEMKANEVSENFSLFIHIFSFIIVFLLVVTFLFILSLDWIMKKTAELLKEGRM